MLLSSETLSVPLSPLLFLLPSPCFILTRPLVLSKNTSASRPLNSLPRYLPSRPQQPLWVLTFQTQSFQSCSLPVIFTPPDALQHNCTLYTVLDLESSASRFHLLFFNIPSSAPFFHSTRRLYSPAASLPRLLFTLVATQTATFSSFPSLTPAIFLINHFIMICFYLFTFAHFLLLPQSALPLNFSNHEAAHTLPSCLHPLFFSIPHSFSSSFHHPSPRLLCCVLRCVLSFRPCLFHL